MKKSSYLVSLCLLSVIASCGDVSSNRKKGTGKGSPVRDTPGISVEDQSGLSIRSHMIREKGSPIIGYVDEIKASLAGTLSTALYRKVPLIEKDNEGSTANVTTVQTIGRPTTPCGVGTFSNVTQRISNCLTENADKAIWDGERYGAAGEGKWTLVMRNSANDEIWLDSRTGMVWSHLIKETSGAKIFNWCKASGNSQTKGEFDCADLGEKMNICESLNAEFNNQIIWRLPTRNDYLQADLNGLRFVHKAETADGLWTATLQAGAENFSKAWIYSSKEGTLVAGELNEEHQMRCIGSPKR